MWPWYEHKIDIKLPNRNFGAINKAHITILFVGRISGFAKPNRYWMGGTDMEEYRTFRWTFSDAQLTYTHWRQFEPFGRNGVERCVEMYHDHGWNDFECKEHLNFICEKRLVKYLNYFLLCDNSSYVCVFKYPLKCYHRILIWITLWRLASITIRVIPYCMLGGTKTIITLHTLHTEDVQLKMHPHFAHFLYQILCALTFTIALDLKCK